MQKYHVLKQIQNKLSVIFFISGFLLDCIWSRSSNLPFPLCCFYLLFKICLLAHAERNLVNCIGIALFPSPVHFLWHYRNSCGFLAFDIMVLSPITIGDNRRASSPLSAGTPPYFNQLFRRPHYHPFPLWSHMVSEFYPAYNLFGMNLTWSRSPLGSDSSVWRKICWSS